MLSALPGIIPGGISVKDFSAIIKTSDSESEKILESLNQNGIGSKQKNLYYFEESDKLRTSIMLIEKGFTNVINVEGGYLAWEKLEN